MVNSKTRTLIMQASLAGFILTKFLPQTNISLGVPFLDVETLAVMGAIYSLWILIFRR